MRPGDGADGQMRKVVVVLATDQRRGAEIRGLELADALRARGARVEVVAAYASSVEQRVDVPTLAASRQRIRAALALRRRARGADVVIGLGPGTLPVAWLGLVGARARFAYSFVFDPVMEARGRWKALAMRVMLRRSDAAVVMWHRAAEAARSRYGLGDGVVRVIPNARSADHFVPADDAARDAARTSMGISPGQRVVAFVGALSATKRPDLAVEAVGMLDDVWLVVAGEGLLRAQLEAGSLAAAGRLRLVGAVDDVVSVYAAADVLVVTSEREGSPGVVIEAALCGVATVAVDVGGVGEMVGGGESAERQRGVLVAAVDAAAVARALGAALPWSAALGAAAREWAVANASWEAVGDRWSALVDELSR